MVKYKIVDTDELDANLTEIADEVRTLTDTSDKMTIDEIKANINQVSEDITEQAEIIAEIKNILNNSDKADKLTIDEAISLFATYNFTADSLVIDCDTIRAYLFWNVSSISKLDIPNAEIIGSQAFYEVSSLKSVRLGNMKSIMDSAFSGCISLERVIIETPTSEDTTPGIDIPPCSIVDTSVFMNTLIETWGEDHYGIYVPRNLVEVYANDTNWIVYPIKAIEDNLDTLASEYPDLLEKYGGNTI